MSLILDALKRSEQERLPGDDVHLGQIYSKNKKRRAFPWKPVLILTLLLNCALLAYFGYQKMSSSTLQPPQPVRVNKAGPETVADPSAKPAEIPGKAKRDTEITAPSKLEGSTTEQVMLSAQLPTDAVPAQQPLSSSLPTITKPVNKKPRKLHKTAQADKASPVQQLSELSNETTINQLSELQINTHIYSDNAEKRFVLINMQKYREGQTLRGSRFKIDKITSDGLIIDYGEGSVRLKAR